MSPLAKLMNSISSAGVRYVELQDIVEISNTGVDKKMIAGEATVSLLNYMDVVRNPRLNARSLSALTSASSTKAAACSIRKGDVFITPSSETVDEIGISAVAEEDIPNSVYSYHIMRLRPKSFSEVLPEYLMYLFRSSSIQSQISRRSQGITRYGLTLPLWRTLRLPLPSLQIQNEIVRILDTFSALEAELEAELEGRKKQFCELRNSLILGETESCDWFTLADIAEEFGRGKSRHRPRNDPKLYGGVYPFIQTGDVRSSGHLITKFSQTYSEAGLAQSKLWAAGTICITIAANIAETGVLTFDACFPDSVLGLRVKSEIASNDYVEYMLQTVKSSLVQKGQGSAQANINLSTFENHRFPFPDIAKQKKIVEILNSLDTLIHSATDGIPAELVARRKQFAYYRDTLLSFGEA